MASGLLPPAVIRLIADAAEMAAGLREATTQIKAAAEQGAAAVKAADDSMALSGEEAAAKWGAAWNAEWARQGAAAEKAALSTQVAQQRALTEGTAEYDAAMAARVRATEAAAEKEKAAQRAAFSDMNDAVSAFGRKAAIGLAGVAAASIYMAAKFDASMEQVHTAAGASQGEVDKLKGSVLNLASQTGQGPDALAAGLYHVESAGYRGAQAMDILSAAAKVATIGNANLEDTAQAMIATVASGIGGVRDMNDAAALLNTTVGIGDMRMSQLAKAMATGILPTAATAGLKFTDVAAALATLTDNATPADQVATHLRMTLTLMAAPTDKAAKALAGIGMSQNQLAMDMRQPNGLLVAVEDLRTHLGAMQTDAQKAAAMQTLADAFGGGKTAGSIMTLIQELPRLQDKYKALGDSTSRAAGLQESWRATQGTFKNSLDRLKSSAEVLGIELGNKLIPPLEKVIEFFAKHKAVAEGLVITLGVLMGLSVAMWIAGIVSGIIAATAAMIGFDAAADANPIGAFVLLAEIAIAALIAAFYEIRKHWKGISEGFITAWHAIEIAWFATWDALKTAWFAVVGALETAWRAVSGAFVTAWDAVVGALKAAWGGIVTAWDAVGSALSTAWHATLSALETAARPFVDAWRATVGGVETSWHAVTHALETAARVTWNAIKTAALDAWHFLEPILKGIATAINYLLLPIRLQVLAWEIAYRAIEKAVTWFWHSVLEPFGKGVASVVTGTIGTAIRWLETAWRTVWNALGTAVNWVWNSVLLPAFHAIVSGVETFIIGNLRLAQAIWHTIWSALGTAVSFAWNSVLLPTFHAIATAFDAVIGFGLRLLQATWNAVWGAIRTALSAIWNGFLSPTFHAIASAFDAVIGFGLRALQVTWNTIWGAIHTAVSTVWNSFLSPTFHAISGAFDAVIGAALRGLKTTWDTLWGGIKSTVTTIWGVLKPIFDSMGRAIKDITGGITGIAKGVGGFVGKLNKIAPFAEGGSPPVGQAVLVGERGPELAVFGAPAYIHPANETKSILAGGKASGGWVGMQPSGSWGGGGQTTIVVEVPVNLDGQVLFKSTQKQALRYNRRNPSNGLARVAGL